MAEQNEYSTQEEQEEKDESRFSRQTRLDGWDQEKISNAKVTVVGLGSLGTVVADMLARAGVGELHLVDYDHIEESNLTRQILYDMDDIGKLKVAAAKERLHEVNPDIKVEIYPNRLTYVAKNHPEIFKSDVVVDCLDGLESKLELNKECVDHEVPLIHGGVHGLRGAIQVVVPNETPCLNCNPMISHAKVIGGPCGDDDTPYVNPTVNMVAAAQAQEAYKIILDDSIGDSLNKHYDLNELMEEEKREKGRTRFKPEDKVGTYVQFIIDEYKPIFSALRKLKHCKHCGEKKSDFML